MTSTPVSLPDRPPEQFLRIAAHGARVQTHAELWQWLQGDVQHWLPHDALLVGWGDFRGGTLHFDLISSVPGLRTHQVNTAAVRPLLGYLRDCWAVAQHAPCHVDLAASRQLMRHPTAEQEGVLAELQTALVHVTHDGVQGDRLFAALRTDPGQPQGWASALRLLLPFIDTALRRMQPAALRHARREPPPRVSVTSAAVLSDREREIMDWVALGKTNPEIGCILHISEFTVKNHMKSIFAKLDVTNRAQAVAKLNRMGAYA